MTGPRGWLERLVDIEPGEGVPAVLAALYFFCLLFGYFMLRPLRDAMGLEGGVDSLRVLFLVTLGVMVVANVVFGAVASRVPRRVFVPLVYWFAIACLCVFVALMLGLGDDRSPLLGNVFFVWLSVFNLFAVSVFWGFMADLFTLKQSKRLFGLIGVGGTAGAICGSAWTGALASWLGDVGLFASASVMIGCAAVIATLLGRRAEHRRMGAEDRALGGVSWQGVADVLRSPYLLGIACYVCLFTILSTLLWFEKMRIVEAFAEDRDARASVLGWIELGGQSATILIQLFITGRLMRRFGVGSILAIVPAVTFVGFVGIAAAPALLMVGAVEATRRACNFALSKPARETLFTVLPRDEKYKAKSVIDTTVYRGGDTIGTLADKGMAMLGTGVWVVALPLSVAGMGLSLWLGRRESERAGRAMRQNTDAGDARGFGTVTGAAPVPMMNER